MDFAEEIFKQANKDVKVNRVTTEGYGISIAKRPHNSRLDKSKLIDSGFKPLPDWKDAVRRHPKEIDLKMILLVIIFAMKLKKLIDSSFVGYSF